MAAIRIGFGKAAIVKSPPWAKSPYHFVQSTPDKGVSPAKLVPYQSKLAVASVACAKTVPLDQGANTVRALNLCVKKALGGGKTGQQRRDEARERRNRRRGVVGKS